MSAEYTKQPYTPLVPVMAQPLNEVVTPHPVVEDKGTVVMTRNPQHEIAIKKASGYVCLLIFFQVLVTFLSLFGGNLIGFVITMVFLFLGIHGVKRQRRGFIIAHFVYSLFTLFILIACFVGLVVYCNDCWLIALAVGIVITIKTLLLRQERILITLLGKTPDLPIVVVKTKEVEPTKVVDEEIPMQQFSAVPADLQQQINVQQPPMMPFFMGAEGQQQPVMYMPMMGATGQPQWIPIAQPGFLPYPFYPGYETQQQVVMVEPEQAESQKQQQ